MVNNYQTKYQIAITLSNRQWKEQTFNQEYLKNLKNMNQQDQWFSSNGILKDLRASNLMKLLFNSSVRIEENADLLATISDGEGQVNSSKWRNISFRPWQVFSHLNAHQHIHTRYKSWVWKHRSLVRSLSKLRVQLWLILPVTFNLMKSLPQGR